MKILVLLLARFGDTLIAWPTLRGLQQKYPDAEIHILVREKFLGATEKLDVPCKVHIMSTASFLGPLFEAVGTGASMDAEVSASIRKIKSFVQGLKKQNFDQVINLSFSPLSSYITSAIVSEDTKVLGYSRTSDGHLDIGNQAGAYFYAHVGVGKWNKRHLVNIFADVADVDLTESNYTGASQPTVDPEDRKVVIHVGASQKKKRWSAERWSYVVSALVDKGYKVTLIGSVGEEIKVVAPVQDLIGKTQFSELHEIIASASIVIGCDSAPMHLCTIYGTRALNLSFGTVNLWETGPLTPGSRILFSDSPENLDAAQVTSEALSMLEDQLPKNASYYVTHERVIKALKHGGPSYRDGLLSWMYFGAKAPSTSDIRIAEGLIAFEDMLNLAIEQLYTLQSNPKDPVAGNILQRSDDLIAGLPQQVPALAPFISWFQTEKCRVPPGNFEFVLEKTFQVYALAKQYNYELQAAVRAESLKEYNNV